MAGGLFSSLITSRRVLFLKGGIVNETKFRHEMARAKTFHDLGQDADYWRGYMRGLRRAYHGENFGTQEDHLKWMALIDDDYRKELGRGYRDGYTPEYCTQNEGDCFTCSLNNYGRDCLNNPVQLQI